MAVVGAAWRLGVLGRHAVQPGQRVACRSLEAGGEKTANTIGLKCGLPPRPEFLLNTSSRLSSSTPRRTGRRSDCSHPLRARSKQPRLAAQLQRAPPQPHPATAADVSWAPEWALAVAAPTCGPPARAPQEAQAKPGSPRAVAAAARAKRRAARASNARLAKVSARGRVRARRWVWVWGRGGVCGHA